LGCGPQTRGAVSRSRDKVVPKRPEADVPDGRGVGFVDYDVGVRVEGPEADCAVCGGGEEVAGFAIVLGGGEGVGLLLRGGEGDCRREREGVDRPGVSD
jgi:hypothetical protein